MKSTKTPDNLNEERLFLSDELRSRLDEDLLSDKARCNENKKYDIYEPIEEASSGYDIELSVGTTELTKKYDVIGWGPGIVSIIVPPEQLSQFHVYEKTLNFRLHESTYIVVETHGSKKDGEWVVSLSYEDI